METMKSMFFACALLLGSAETFSAENLVLSEDFESQTGRRKSRCEGI